MSFIGALSGPIRFPPPASRRWWTKVSSGARKLAMLVLLAITLTVLIALAAMAYLANVPVVDMRL
ncbi:hypothetical protein [Mesorhizobium sp.]|uniref:hypothetical protein n=1 Tax=Mesorhizobium sp. TaxID=1871066 RepID=UPI000FE50025|nr:hypothetical protein [Mesorhizobium sp.]RWK59732.1 MAG: hypothetical protein EOR49_25170 [Mesorhizobium sp.]RWM44209.1 MAG: hypothetical protein EOR76_25645 [Mesorhizobium sp.]RWM49583.1 MAG: hypothetical protein EOR78_27435 [Mesorhizobium sp.]RWM61503.1 MAG: hypothetical protein EOR79_03860 [Mesorhizobium sp.]RWM88477.1 MAG: hypothetical protein EOR85_34415 [Mesorhizobium sp.]